MKIVELVAENVKRIKSVEITLDDTLQVIGGRNAQGKSSLFDAIAMALGGGRAAKDTPRPIRDGEDTAMVRLDLGDMVVTRKWTASGSTLKVQNAEGVPARSPQTLLDTLVGRISFDPLEFTRLSHTAQKDALLEIIGLKEEIASLEAQTKKVYGDRTEIGRRGKELGSPIVDHSLPTTELSLQEGLARLREAEESNRRYQNHVESLRRAEENVNLLEVNLQRLIDQLEGARREVAQMSAAMPPAPVDTSAMEAELSNVDGLNARIRLNNHAREAFNLREELLNQYEGATQELQRLTSVKAGLLSNARFPIEGLSFTDSEVLYKGVPLSQASSADKIKVSTAMGMALNPHLRVLTIRDGSLLDEESMRAIYRQAESADFQVLVERVGDEDEGAVIIEDGEVLRHNRIPQAEAF